MGTAEFEFTIKETSYIYIYIRLMLGCLQTNVSIDYYESIIDNCGGIIPNIKKCKVAGSIKNVRLFKEYLNTTGLSNLFTGNPASLSTRFIPG